MWTQISSDNSFIEFFAENKRLDIAVRGEWEGEIVIQRKFKDNSNLPEEHQWGTIDTLLANAEIYELIPNPEHKYRVGFLSGGRISGTAYIGFERSFS